MPISSFPIQTQNVTGLPPISSSNGTKIFIVSGTGAYLVDASNFISSAGVNTLNTLSGNVLLTGTGNISITRNSQTIIISGNTGAYSNFVTPSQTGLLTGQFVSRSETGGFGGGTSQAGVTSLAATGVANTGYFTGSVMLSGVGNIVVSTGDNNLKLIRISGDTGAYANFLTPSSTGGFVNSTQTGLLTNVFYPLNTNPSNYLTVSSNVGVRSLQTTGAYPSGTISGSVVVSGVSIISVTTGAAGQLVISGNTGMFDNFTSDSELLSASGYIVSLINAASAGVSSLNGQSGVLQILGSGNITIFTGAGFITVSGNTGAYANFITPSQTGNFVTNGMTGALTGDFIRRSETGQFAASGNLTASGINLQNQLNTITTWTGTTPTIFSNINHGHNYVTGISVTGGASQTGKIDISGFGDIVVSTGISGLIQISGNTGAYANFVTPGQTGLLTNAFVLRSETGGFGGGSSVGGVSSVGATGLINTGSFSGNVLLSGAGNVTTFTGDVSSKLIVVSGNTGAYANFVSLSQTGGLVSSANTGNFVTTGQTGLLTNVFYPLNTNPSNYLTVSTVGGVRTLTTTGAFPSGVVSGNVTISGISIISVTTGAAGQIVISGNTGMFDNFTTDSELLGTSGYLVTLINASSAGVSSLNGQSGVLQILGSGNITIFTGAGYITVSGNTGAYANFLTPATVGGVRTITLTGHPTQSGIISGNITLTGAGNINVYTGTSGIGIVSGDTGAYANFVSLSQTGGLVSSANTGNFVTTGQTGLLTNVFYPLNSNPSNYLTVSSNVGVRTIQTTGTYPSGIVSGNVILSGAGNTSVYTGANGIIIISGTGGGVSQGTSAGVNSIAATGITNTGFFTGDIMFTGAGNIVVSTGTPINKLVVVSGDTGAYANFVSLSQTGNVVNTSQTGGFLTLGNVGGVRGIVATGTTRSGIVSGNVIVTGAGNTTVETGVSGLIIVSGNTGAYANFVTLSQTGNVVNTSQTGGFASIQVTGSPLLSLVNLTGAGNVTVTTGATPLVIVSGNTGAYANFITPSQSGLLTGAFYPLNSNPAGYLTSSSAGVTSIVATGTTNSGSLTGVVKISGAGNVTIFTGISGSIIVSGNTGQLTGQFYPLYTNPSGYIMGTTGTGILDGQLLIGSSGINGFQQGDLYATTGLIILSGSGSLGVGIDVSKVVTGLVAGTNVSVSNNGTGLWTINATSAGSSGINSITTTGAYPSGIRSGSVFISGAGNVTVTTGTNNSIVVSGAGGGGVAAGINTVGATGTLNTGYFTGDVLFSGAGSIVVSTGNTSSKLIVISGGTNTVNNLYTVANFSGLNKMWVPAAAMTPSQITGATTGQIFTAGSGHTIDTLNFLSGSGQSAYFNLSFPKVWDKTNVVPVFYWTTTGNVGTINWGIASANIDDGASLDIQYNQGTIITDSTISGNYLHQTTGAPLSISGTLSDDDQCYFKVYRSAGGTLADEGKLIGVGIGYYETGVNATPSGINSITTTGAYPSGIVTGNVVVSGAGIVSVYTGDFGSIIISGTSVGGPGGTAGVNSIAATGTTNTGYHTGDIMFSGAGNIVVSTGIPINKLIIVSGNTGAYNVFALKSETGTLLPSGGQRAFKTAINTGIDTQFIDFSPNFSSIPIVVTTLENSGANYFNNISGVTISGFYCLISDIVQESGVYLHTFARV